MATRTDVRVAWSLSPRVVTVDAPSTSISIQDLHDTLRILEQRPTNLVYPSLISSAGKENLGSGVSVGITSTLRNAQLAFAARKVWTSTGTITTTDATGRVLVDTGATFQTDGVKPGAWVVNLTDGSICTVLTVDSQQQITTDVLGGGTGNAFTLNDLYKILNVVQVEANGGNLVAIDSIGADISAILPTAGTQVVRTSSSSATLQELQDIQYSSFNGGVTYDPTSPYSGTAYPIGTPRQPVNNLTSAKFILNTRGFTTIFIVGNAVIDNDGDYSSIVFIGESKTRSEVTISSGANVTACEFYNCTINGTLDGNVRLKDCCVQDVTYVDGYIEKCVLGPGTITLSGINTATFLDCWCGVGTSHPTIDMGGTGSALIMRGYSGGIIVTNKSGTDAVRIDLNSGHVVLTDTVTNGPIEIRGVGTLDDSSTGSPTITTDGLINPTSVSDKVWAKPEVELTTGAGNMLTRIDKTAGDNQALILAG
jgi:hypothetical protein